MNRELKNLEDWWDNSEKNKNKKSQYKGLKSKLGRRRKKTIIIDEFKAPLPLSKDFLFIFRP